MRRGKCRLGIDLRAGYNAGGAGGVGGYPRFALLFVAFGDARRTMPPREIPAFAGMEYIFALLARRAAVGRLRARAKRIAWR